MVSYFARQPIMDQNARLYAYELLYRRGRDEVSLTGAFDENKATSSVMETFLSLGTEKISGGKKAFINFTQQLILDGFATLFRPDALVVEILENIEPSDELLERIAELKRAGFVIALDDFVYNKDYKKFLDVADIVKVDFNTPKYLENMKKIIPNIDLKRCVLLAEKVETHEMLEAAKKLGCKLFQGYYFARPVTLAERVIEPMKLNYLQLIGIVCRREVDFMSVARIIRRDVALSYKILRLVNSAYFGLRNEIKDIQQAVAFLGERELKKWVSFVSLGGMNENKPGELIRMSMTRAHFCEVVALEAGYRLDSEAFFLTGLFSLLDALMDSDLEVLLIGISMPERARRALLGETGPERNALSLITAIEYGNWDEVTQLCRRLKISEAGVGELYLDSVRWCNELLL